MISSAKKIELASVDDLFSTEDSRQDEQLEKIQEIMSRDVYVLRDRAGLQRAQTELEKLSPHATLVARALVAPALAREESRGTHRRTDFPHRREEWRRHLDVQLGSDGTSLEVRETPV